MLSYPIPIPYYSSCLLYQPHPALPAPPTSLVVSEPGLVEQVPNRLQITHLQEGNVRVVKSGMEQKNY